MNYANEPGGARSARRQRSPGVQDVLRDWEFDATDRLRLHPRTIEQTRTAMQALAAHANESDIRRITPLKVLDWLTAQPSPRTAMHRRSLVGYVFRHAMLLGHLQQNPAAMVPLPRSAPGRGADYLTKEEAESVIRVALADSGDGRKTGFERARFYLFLWATALRYSEARAQEWCDIDWSAGTMRVTKDKARRCDTISLPPWFTEQLRHYPRADHHLIFERTPSHHMLERDYRVAGVKGKGGWHRWRKGAISYVASCEIPLWEIQRFSRHRSVAILVRNYIRCETRQLARAQGLMSIRAAAG
jgi:integrase